MSRIARTLLVAACSTMVAACGERPSGQTATQVAARVNKEEISVHQVNSQLARVQAGALNDEQRSALRKQVVDKLVDQQLLVEKAMEAKMDRDPLVLEAIEASRRQILAQAYVQKKIAADAKPGEQEIKKYYDENPALFAQRKNYRLQELLTNLPTERLPDLEAQIARSKSIGDIAGWLRSSGYQFSTSAAVRGAEQIPLAALPRVSAMRDGEVITFPNSNNQIIVLQVVSTQAQPLDEKAATPYIEQFLANRKREELLRQELQQLRSTASIEYVGDTAAAVKTGAATGAGATATGAADGGAPEQAVDAAAKASGSAVEKGVAGLR